MTPDYSSWRAFIAAFLSLLCGPIILPFIFGGLILKKYVQDRFSRLIGLFIMKSVVTYPLWFFVLHSPFISDTVQVILPVLMEIGLTIGLIILLKNLLSAKDRYLWSVMLLDMSRWFITLLGFYSVANTSFRSLQWFIAMMNFAYPSILTAVAWMVVLARNRISPNSPNILSR